MRDKLESGCCRPIEGTGLIARLKLKSILGKRESKEDGEEWTGVVKIESNGIRVRGTF